MGCRVKAGFPLQGWWIGSNARSSAALLFEGGLGDRTVAELLPAFKSCCCVLLVAFARGTMRVYEETALPTTIVRNTIGDFLLFGQNS